MKKNVLLCFFLFIASEIFSQNVTVYTVCTEDSDFSKVTQTITTQEEAETDYKTLILGCDNHRKEIIGSGGSCFDIIPTKEELKEMVNDAIQNLYKKQSQNQSKNSSVDNKFKTLMRYDIKGISVNNNLVCPLNGFNHGTIDYGIYKQRGFYFAIKFDNAVFGEGITILETVDFKNFNNANNKGMEFTLKEISGMDNDVCTGYFMETKEEGIIYLSITKEVEGKEITMMYIMIPQKSE